MVGFNTGVVLSSGTATDVVGPNVSDSVTTDFLGAGDPDLTALSGFDTFDAAVLEFDFTPDASQVVFHYTFASDEYSEWVATPYNDVFAFFVNGTNYAEVRQVAGDPTSPFVAVTVNNINNSNPVLDPPPTPMRPDLYRDNSFSPSGPSIVDLELDGTTTVLNLQAPVVPGETNHMKLAISDASDGIYDSAVFIEAGSLVSNDNPVADLSLDPEEGGPAPLNVTAFIEGEDPNDLGLTYSLDWGDGSDAATGPVIGETASATHLYTVPGEYLLTLTVSNGTLTGTAVEDLDVTGGGGGGDDTTPPELDPSFSASMPFLVGATGIAVNPNASDDESGVSSESCTDVDTSVPGLHYVTCTATDNAGNSASIDVAYVVGYDVVVLKPVADQTFRSRAGISVTFQLVDANGVISDANATSVLPAIDVRFDTQQPGALKYLKKNDTFNTTLKTNYPPVGPYEVRIDVVIEGVQVASAVVPVTIV